jgi:flavin-dependent dehydrogenase
MLPSHDVVIVGGGPAGLSTALFLTHLEPRLRKRIVVLESAHYPREKICGGAVAARGDQALAEIGVHVDVPSVAFSRMSVAMSVGTHVTRPGAALGRVIRRIEFDHRLAEIARARGIAIEEGVKVQTYQADSDGVTLRTSAGELRAKVVVGADGVSGVIRKGIVGQESATWRAQVLEIDTEVLPNDRPRDLVHFDLSDHSLLGYAWDFPTQIQGEARVCRGVYRLIAPGESAGPEQVEMRLRRRLADIGLDLAGYKKKRFAERGFAPHEPVSTERVLLVGEAAGIDPITGEGIAHAIVYGKTVAPYLRDRLDSGALHFQDWRRHLALSPLGRDLLVRHIICRLAYGPARAFHERFCADNPVTFEAGAQYFGGHSVSSLDLLKIGASGAANLLRGLGAAPLRGLPVPKSASAPRT